MMHLRGARFGGSVLGRIGRPQRGLLRQCEPSDDRQRRRRWEKSLGAAAAATLLLLQTALQEDDEEPVVNWSGTHVCYPVRVYTPETTAEAAGLVKEHQDKRSPLRPCGSTLSPNGIGFCRQDGGALLNMGLCDDILEIDKEKRLIRVECGARVDQVLEALDKEGMTLENLASIAAQQIGGFIQVGAHGTGATLPPVDCQVESFKVATPAYGVIEMTKDHPMFDLALVGLGCFGVCLEATLRCVPKHLLRERVTVLTRAEAKDQCASILLQNRHARFMWIPHVDAVVCVTNNPTLPGCLGEGQGIPPVYSMDERLKPLRDLLERRRAEKKREYDDQKVRRAAMICDGDGKDEHSDVTTLNFAQLRDELIKMDPLSLDHIVQVNQAEAEFWHRSQGVDVADSSLKLNFECGGQQWVNECAFPVDPVTSSTSKRLDVQYLLDLLCIIEAEGIPAPAPIEQRWTTASRARMSPASSRRRDDQSLDLFSWVGIIMYLPTDDPVQRQAITDAFSHYKRRCEDLLWPRYGAVEHWAKIELPTDLSHAARVRSRLANRFPTADFAVARKYFDPYGILTNDLLDAILPRLPTDDSDDAYSYAHYASDGAWPVCPSSLPDVDDS